MTPAEAKELDLLHHKEKDRKTADRIKSVLLSSEGWTQMAIAQALRLDPKTIYLYLEDYKTSKKLRANHVGCTAHYLNNEQTELLIKHLETEVYTKASDICAYVDKTFNIKFTVSGITKWLQTNRFSYKKPKGIPAKADPEKQKAFIEFYATLQNTTPEDEPIEFMDGVHPTMATKISYGWIRKGKDHPIETTGSKERMNIMGSINLETMDVTYKSYKTLDAESTQDFLSQVRAKYPKASKIHLILDQGSYNKSKETQKKAKELGIVLHYLPSYSPNLNPIERLWKVMNEKARNNKFFETAKEFRQAIVDFFEITWPQIATSMVDRINDNFETLKRA